MSPKLFHCFQLKENPQLVDMQNVPHVESKVDDGAASVATVPPAQPAPVQPISIRNEDISDEVSFCQIKFNFSSLFLL